MRSSRSAYLAIDKTERSLSNHCEWLPIVSYPKPFTLVWVVSTCTAIFAPAIALAQPIIPDNDGTGTLVTPESDRFNIHGGQTSGDGSNLFHSFQEFGLDAGQTANFQSCPEIQNILGRITGGNASLIDGLIEVTGSNANLFLMNPAGIVFGENAQLNVPSSFTATTATGIGLDGGWFNAFGTNDYTALVGTPNAFDFAIFEPGAIVNHGNLTVAEGSNLSLFGGTVVSTGTLQADGGEISVAAVPGENLLRLSAEGNILSLEVSPATSSFSLLNPRSLPELLTLGESIADADTLVVNPDGTVALTGSGLRVEDGDVAVAGGKNSEPNLRSGSAILAADRNLTLTESQLSTTDDLTLLAGDTLQVRDSIANPVLTEAGGNLSLRGTRGIDILALNHPQTPFVSGGDLSLASGGFISGDAHYSTGGNFSILTLDGEPGEFFSLIDPIIFANGDVTFGDYTGPSLVIEATGEITTGNITINGIDPNIADEPVLILRAGRTPTPITLAAGGTTTQEGTVFSAASTAAAPPRN
ncbi:filamentous hemagglutinin N-terminal domain-containing protein [Oscillatoriales cyanobacterium LEGE 11467]|uniref:Filamentous hemagglutinin N-terminal domain-containing protein n=1 Tax=Zarconia navalis LEGE 11467 TaxID=1828826 RepID=A0A928VXC7_9CYAN|nr:filamentous hemagglutinin N-terminal domain-containing protein [Zarconia navalis LEGE 11467]